TQLKHCFSRESSTGCFRIGARPPSIKDMLDADPPTKREGDPVMADRLRWVISKMSMTKAEIAETLGVSQQAITGWEKTGRISKRNLVGLAELSGHPLQYLMHGTGPDSLGLNFSDFLPHRPEKPPVGGQAKRDDSRVREPERDYLDSEWADVPGASQMAALGD